MPTGRTKIVYKPDRKYVIQTPNQDYTGRTAGLEFSKGRGIIDPDTYRNLADETRTPEETLARIQEDNPDYQIEERTPLYLVPDTESLRTPAGRLRTKADKAAKAAETEE